MRSAPCATASFRATFKPNLAHAFVSVTNGAVGIADFTFGKLLVGTQVRWITKPWEDGNYEDGWFGGLLDGEGSIAKK